ncbi:MAG TPA: hypothetical protein VGC92_04145, partial [Phenylobacterium sp.]
ELSEFLRIAEGHAVRRQKPESTSVLFTDQDKAKLVTEIVDKTLAFEEGEAPESLQRQVTGDSYMFATFQKSERKAARKQFTLSAAGDGKIKYAAEGAKILGGHQYQVNHLDGIVPD